MVGGLFYCRSAIFHCSFVIIDYFHVFPATWATVHADDRKYYCSLLLSVLHEYVHYFYQNAYSIYLLFVHAKFSFCRLYLLSSLCVYILKKFVLNEQFLERYTRTVICFDAKYVLVQHCV